MYTFHFSSSRLNLVSKMWFPFLTTTHADMHALLFFSYNTSLFRCLRTCTFSHFHYDWCLVVKNKCRTWHFMFHIQFHIATACRRRKQRQEYNTREWDIESTFVCCQILVCLLARNATHSTVWVCVCVHFLECRPSFELDSFNFYVIYHLGFSLTSFLTFQFPIHGAAASRVCVLFVLCYFYV